MSDRLVEHPKLRSNAPGGLKVSDDGSGIEIWLTGGANEKGGLTTETIDTAYSADISVSKDDLQTLFEFAVRHKLVDVPISEAIQESISEAEDAFGRLRKAVSNNRRIS